MLWLEICHFACGELVPLVKMYPACFMLTPSQMEDTFRSKVEWRSLAIQGDIQTYQDVA